MLPSVVASELEQVAADAIRTAFHPTTPGFAGLIDRFLAEREQLLKGPYDVGAFYWTVPAPDIVNSGREEQGSVSV